MLFRCISLVALAMTAIACGSSDGSSTAATLKIMSPEAGSVYTAGDAVEYEIETLGFVLAPPFNKRSLRDHPGEEEMTHEDSHADSHGSSHEDMSTPEEHQDDHDTMPHEHESDAHSDDHGADDTNPTAREGHYHVYLDAAAGSDPHLTSWSYIDSFELPADLTPGTHTLRFELRDNNHMLVGSTGSEAVLFFEVK